VSRKLPSWWELSAVFGVATTAPGIASSGLVCAVQEGSYLTAKILRKLKWMRRQEN